MELDAIVTLMTEWAWVGWLALIAIFLVIEMLTLDFTFLMLAVGSGAGLVTGLFDAPVWLQFLIAAIAAVCLILLLRPPLLKRLHRDTDPAKTNVDALIGLGGFVLREVSSVSGQVKLSNGDIWTARSSVASVIPSGVQVVVESIEGATAVVRPNHV
jgi:membrane protein implicated in regulation of membrane protease activity